MGESERLNVARHWASSVYGRLYMVYSYSTTLMDTAMLIQQVIAGIGTGQFDAQLATFSSEIRRRQELLTLTKGHSLHVGDRVVFNGKTRPRYLVGLFAKVLDVNQVTAWCALEEGPVGKFRGQKIRVPFALIDKSA